MQASDLKTGVIFQEDGEPFKVEKYDHKKVARGSGHVKIKARSLVSGKLISKSCLSSDRVENAYVDRKNMQFLYRNREEFVFMDPSSYEQITIPSSVVGDRGRFIGEGSEVVVLFFEQRPVSVEISRSVVLTVSYTEPAQKGNTVTNAFKDAEFENGSSAKVPLFVEIGDRIKINTDTGEYVSRA